MGSLAPNVPEHFNAQFDVVVGNPPWKRLRPSPNTEVGRTEQRAQNVATNQVFSEISRRVLATRQIKGLNVASYENPDNNPDLPFLWRAAEWAKPGGSIAMALPARIILKQSDKGRLAREALLRGLTVNGILNCSDLEKTAVWPNMDLPFMLLFARNSLPSSGHQFSFVTPVRERRLSKQGEFRIDFRSAQTLSVESAVAKPWLLKTLGLGSALDVEVLEKISASDFPTVSDIWTGLSSGEGYNISPRLPQKPADHLLNLPNFKPPQLGVEFDVERLKTWRDVHRRETAHAPRKAHLYEPPLVIVPQTPGEKQDTPKAYLSEKHAVAFSKSFYGYSTAGHNNPEGLARLLYLVVHSQLWRHHYFTHSSRIGASYRTLLKEDLDGFPFPNPNALTPVQWRRVDRLAKELPGNDPDSRKEVDKLVLDFYGLNTHDATVIGDTVRFGAPYRSARLSAEGPPRGDDVDAFCRYLVNMIQPFVKGIEAELCAAEPGGQTETTLAPWRFISLTPHNSKVDIAPSFILDVMQEANRHAASRILMVLPQGGLFIGLLNQLRFWSQSGARLCGLHIIRQHLSAFRADE